MDKIIDGKEIQNILKEEYKNKINLIKDKLKLVVIQVGDDPASSVYVRNKGKICEEVGICFEHKKFDFISEDDLISLIESLNDDKDVNGILVQLPLPDGMNADKIINKISPLKDVDGLTTSNIGKLFAGEKGLVPCTALGVMKCLDYANVSLEGANVAIVGRSKLVGLPLISLLLKRNASVNVYHSKTVDLKEKTSMADVLIVAVGRANLIKEDFVKDGAVVIDVGINRAFGKLCGDCDYSSLYDKVSYITPVPGGVGQLTVVMLVNNVIEAYNLQK